MHKKVLKNSPSLFRCSGSRMDIGVQRIIFFTCAKNGTKTVLKITKK
jgi:hypothetical protein